MTLQDDGVGFRADQVQEGLLWTFHDAGSGQKLGGRREIISKPGAERGSGSRCRIYEQKRS